MINQGDLYWLELDTPRGSEPGYRHPVVVIQSDLFNHTQIRTVVVCELTPNLKYAKAPGNVTLNKGEANLPKQSVVNITQIYTANKVELLDYIDTVSPKRLREILSDVNLLIEPRDAD